MLDGTAVVVDGTRGERADDPVVHEDDGDGQAERHPVLVQGDDGDHDEEVEVALDGAAHQVDDDRRAEHQGDGGDAAAGTAGQAAAGGGVRTERRHRHVGEEVLDRHAFDEAGNGEDHRVD